MRGDGFRELSTHGGAREDEGGMEVDEGRLGADAPLVDETREETMLPSAK